MKKILLLVSIFTTIEWSHGMSKKPEPLPEVEEIVVEEPALPEAPVIIKKPLVLQETYDRTTQLVHFDIVPFEVKNFTKKSGFSTLTIQASISRHAVKGIADLHLWVGLNQEKSSQDNTPFKAEFLVFDTIGKEVRLPISHKEQLQSNTEYGEEESIFRGYAYLFSEDLNQLADLLSDGQYGDTLSKKHKQTPGTHVANMNALRSLSESIILKQKTITVSLQSKDRELSWETSADDLYMLLEAILLREDLAGSPLLP